MTWRLLSVSTWSWDAGGWGESGALVRLHGSKSVRGFAHVVPVASLPMSCRIFLVRGCNCYIS